MSAGRTSHGFTLLEVMVALAILAAAMLGTLELTSSALRNHERAVHLEIATLLARGKLASLQDGFEKDGFRDLDQTDEGTFERDGHPEVHWKLEVIRPKIELGPEQLLAVFMGATGEDAQAADLAKLLGGKSTSKDGASGGVESLFPGAAAMMAPLKTQMAVIGEQMKKGLREIRLTVAWKDGSHDESFTVVTHMIAYAKGVIP